MKISFIVIVLNGMPFVKPAIEAVYEFAHEIIIIEGAVEKCRFAANPDGSSLDGTVACIQGFPDEDQKIKLIQGTWPEKVDMQNKALEFVTGDYIWLIDSDEIYKRSDIEFVLNLLDVNPSVTQINFIGDNFWKGFDYIFVSPKFFEKPAHFRRVFKYLPGSRFTSHRPPTLFWPGFQRSTEEIHLIDGMSTRKMGIIPYHYSYVYPEQVGQKIELYNRYGWGEMWNLDMNAWYEDFYLQWTPENRLELEKRYPVWTGDPNSYTSLFQGEHPEVMESLVENFHPEMKVVGGAS